MMDDVYVRKRNGAPGRRTSWRSADRLSSRNELSAGTFARASCRGCWGAPVQGLSQPKHLRCLVSAMGHLRPHRTPSRPVPAVWRRFRTAFRQRRKLIEDEGPKSVWIINRNPGESFYFLNVERNEPHKVSIAITNHGVPTDVRLAVLRVA